jgi:hypothetical protein
MLMSCITRRQILRSTQLTQTKHTCYPRTIETMKIDLKLLLVNLPHVLIFFYRATGYEPEHCDIPSLPQPERAILRLQVPTAKDK